MAIFKGHFQLCKSWRHLEQIANCDNTNMAKFIQLLWLTYINSCFIVDHDFIGLPIDVRHKLNDLGADDSLELKCF